MTDEPKQQTKPTAALESDVPKATEPQEAPAVEESEEFVESDESVEQTAPAPKKRMSKEAMAMRNMWIVIGGLAFLLMISLLTRQSQPGPAPATADEAEVAAIRADLEVRLSELNRQRAELDLPPLSGRGEGATEITARLRKDADTLVSLIERYQQLVTEKDRELAEKNIEIIRSEQRREAVAAELAEARGTPREDSGASAQLQEELAEALQRSSRLTEELTAARRSLAELEANPPSDEVDILNRRLEEAKSARDFFEQRAALLENRLNNGEEPEESNDDEDGEP